LTSSFVTNVAQSSAIPPNVKQEAQVELAGGVPFISDADLDAALEEANVDADTTEATLDAYAEARIDGLRSALAILAVLALLALFLAQGIPRAPPGAVEPK
jgi:hypothetical protein